MANDFLLARNTISGINGELVAIVDGQKRTMAHIKNVTVNMAKVKNEVKTLNQRGTQHKASGYNGTGSMTWYYVSTEEVKYMVNYAKTGKDVYFMLYIKNHDLGAEIGSQVILLDQVNFDDMEIAKLDVEATTLERTASFTWTGIEILEEFGDYL